MIRLGLRAAVLAIGPARAADAPATKLANLIVLAKDPLADIENLKSLELTIKRGRAYARADFKPLTEQDLKEAE